MAAGLAAVPARADAWLEAVRAEAARMGPTAFERTSETTDRSGGVVRRVERFMPTGSGGQGAWTLVAVDGRPPTADERRRHAKEVAGLPPPGYWRLATILRGRVTLVRDAQGRTVHRIRPLPEGSIRTARGDISADVAADARIELVAGQPTVTSLRVFAPAPFSLMGVARMNRFEAQSRYERGPDGRPLLVEQASEAEVRVPVVGTFRQTTRQTYRPL